MTYQEFVKGIITDIEKAGKPVLVEKKHLSILFPQNKRVASIACVLRERYGLYVSYVVVNGIEYYSINIKVSEALIEYVKTIRSENKEELQYNIKMKAMWITLTVMFSLSWVIFYILLFLSGKGLL